MKKILLMLALAIATNYTYAQGVLGTQNTSSTDFDFQTNGTFRARLLGAGPLVYGHVVDPDPGSYYRKVVFSSDHDLLMYNNSNIFIDPSSKIYSGPLTSYRGTSGYSFLQLFHPSDGSVVLNSNSNEIFLQPDRGTVYVGKAYYHSIPTDLNQLHVAGSAHANGYAANIEKIDHTASPFTADNDDYTILGDASGGNITVNLPTTTVPHGRIFVIKNISTSGATGVVTVNSADGGAVTLNNPNESIMVQLYIDTSVTPVTYSYYIISDK